MPKPSERATDNRGSGFHGIYLDVVICLHDFELLQYLSAIPYLARGNAAVSRIAVISSSSYISHSKSISLSPRVQRAREPHPTPPNGQTPYRGKEGRKEARNNGCWGTTQVPTVNPPPKKNDHPFRCCRCQLQAVGVNCLSISALQHIVVHRRHVRGVISYLLCYDWHFPGLHGLFPQMTAWHHRRTKETQTSKLHRKAGSARWHRHVMPGLAWWLGSP